jgi:hypothetical protein
LLSEYSMPPQEQEAGTRPRALDRSERRTSRFVQRAELSMGGSEGSVRCTVLVPATQRV